MKQYNLSRRMIHIWQQNSRRCYLALLLIGLIAGTFTIPHTFQTIAQGVAPTEEGQHPQSFVPMALAIAPITTLPNDQLRPRTAYSGQADQYLAVWEHAYSTTDYDIYARRVGSNGAPLGTEIGIATTGIHQNHPDVVTHPTANEYLIVWEHEYSAIDHDIHA